MAMPIDAVRSFAKSFAKLCETPQFAEIYAEGKVLSADVTEEDRSVYEEMRQKKIVEVINDHYSITLHLLRMFTFNNDDISYRSRSDTASRIRELTGIANDVRNASKSGLDVAPLEIKFDSIARDLSTDLDSWSWGMRRGAESEFASIKNYESRKSAAQFCISEVLLAINDISLLYKPSNISISPLGSTSTLYESYRKWISCNVDFWSSQCDKACKIVQKYADLGKERNRFSDVSRAYLEARQSGEALREDVPLMAPKRALKLTRRPDMTSDDPDLEDAILSAVTKRRAKRAAVIEEFGNRAASSFVGVPTTKVVSRGEMMRPVDVAMNDLFNRVRDGNERIAISDIPAGERPPGLSHQLIVIGQGPHLKGVRIEVIRRRVAPMSGNFVIEDIILCPI